MCLPNCITNWHQAGLRRAFIDSVLWEGVTDKYIQVTHLRPGHCDVLQRGAGNTNEIEHIKVITTWSRRLQWQVYL